jgi:formamidopyrimidine-DNA glycosylase
MPEGLEVEIWRRAATPIVGRTITGAHVDRTVVPPGFVESVVGEDVTAVRRAGKILLIDTTGPTIGLHFGMTGRLVVDGIAPIERLEYASGRDDPSWDRVVIVGDDRPTPMLRLNDPRRLGRASLDEDVGGLGVDFTAVTPRRLAAALAGRRAAIKSVLLDQHVVAGLGNLCADEVLWWAGIDPHRGAATLGPEEIELLARTIGRRLPSMLRAGGSHTGTLSPAVRSACPPCPRDGHPLRRDRLGGRTAVWCPGHQH